MHHQDQIDEFESMFRRAERETFTFADIPINSIALITDRDQVATETLQQTVLKFMPRLESAASWHAITGDTYANVGELLQRIDDQQLDLIITYRHLQEQSLVPRHSLGVFLDVLTQSTSIPVLVLPGTAAKPVSIAERYCNRVMVVADHISGDNRLINYGVRMCSPGGTIWLCHIEDDAVFERYMRAIERIPEIESEQARKLIGEQLLKEAGDFITTCVETLREDGPNVTYQQNVQRGHHLRQYRKLIDSHDIDLLVLNTKDEGQLAMHGKAYSVSVEFSDVAMLLL